MDKAKSMLEKQGWKEGTSLGKNGDGITSAIKVPLKMNTSGLGYQFGKVLTEDWWASAYNNAAKNVQISRDDEGLKVNLQKTDIKKASRQLFKDRFKQAHELSTVDQDAAIVHEPLKMIKGITCHKAARHGIRMSGKLERVNRQEKELLASLGSGTEPVPSKKSKRGE